MIRAGRQPMTERKLISGEEITSLGYRDLGFASVRTSAYAPVSTAPASNTPASTGNPQYSSIYRKLKRPRSSKAVEFSMKPWTSTPSLLDRFRKNMATQKAIINSRKNPEPNDAQSPTRKVKVKWTRKHTPIERTASAPA